MDNDDTRCLSTQKVSFDSSLNTVFAKRLS